MSADGSGFAGICKTPGGLRVQSGLNMPEMPNLPAAPGRPGKMSKRLTAMTDMLAEALPKGAPDRAAVVLADVGTDHAGLLIALAKAGCIDRGVGIEIADGPYCRAQANVLAHCLTDRIEIRYGDGLCPLAAGEAMACAIAGMGGKAITQILENSPATTAALSLLLLQPANAEKRLRLYLQKSGWAIIREALVEEKGIIYPIILTQPGVTATLSAAQAEFGPRLLEERPPLLAAMVSEKIRKNSQIIRHLALSTSEESRRKRASLLKQIREWEALLQ